MANIAFAKTDSSVLLDLLRGMAALLVVLEHWRNLFFVDYPQIPGHRLLYLVPYSLSSAGHQSVVIFFVLSGFLVGGSAIRMLNRGQWSWRTYSIHRLSRLWHHGVSYRRVEALDGKRIAICAETDDGGGKGSVSPELAVDV